MSLARARALAIVGILVVAALVLVVAAIVKDKQSNASYASGACAGGKIPIPLKLPERSKVKVNVYNGTGEPNPNAKAAKVHPVINAVANLGGQVADDLHNRGYIVNKVEEHPQKFDHIARLTYGPKGVAAATVVRGEFLGQTDAGGFDLKRNDDVVDVTIGSAFKELGSRTEVNQMLGQLGNPSPPPGTCDGGN